ncbi:MAG: methyltransferase domain-containing protein [Acidobacteriota bacterium]
MTQPPAHLFRRRLFVRGYELLTSQRFWRAHAARLLDVAGDAAYAGRDGAATLRVLDLGCGPGESTFALVDALAERGQRAHVVGLDFAAAGIARARDVQLRRLRADADAATGAFLVADAAHLPVPDDHVDLVTGHSFLYLLPDADAVLRAAHRALRPDGVAVFMEPARGRLRDAAAQLDADSRRRALRHPLAALRFAGSMVTWRRFSGRRARFDAPRLDALLRRAGFADVDVAPTLGGLALHARGRRRA